MASLRLVYFIPGCVCILGTIIALFAKVVAGYEPPNVNHLYIALSLIVAIAAGHYVGDRDVPLTPGTIVYKVLFFCVFVFTTSLCVALSGSRSAAIYEARDAEAADARSKLATLKERVSELARVTDAARETYRKANDAATEAEKIAATECASGKGSKCDGKRTTAADERAKATTEYARYEKAVAEQDQKSTELNNISAPPVANGDVHEMARVWNALTGVDEDTAQGKIKRLLPYTFAMIAELAGILFLQISWHPPARTTAITKHVTISDIAHDLKVPDRKVRKIVRQLNIPKTADGYVFIRGKETDAIIERIRAATATVH